MNNKTDVHTEHCCKQCFCKYGKDNCTVMTGELQQSYKHRDTSVCWDLLDHTKEQLILEEIYKSGYIINDELKLRIKKYFDII